LKIHSRAWGEVYNWGGGINNNNNNDNDIKQQRTTNNEGGMNTNGVLQVRFFTLRARVRAVISLCSAVSARYVLGRTRDIYNNNKKKGINNNKQQHRDRVSLLLLRLRT